MGNGGEVRSKPLTNKPCGEDSSLPLLLLTSNPFFTVPESDTDSPPLSSAISPPPPPPPPPPNQVLSLSISSFLQSPLFLIPSYPGASSVTQRLQDVFPIATGHEREELLADLEGRDILQINHPVGPFGTKEAPAVVKSYFDRRIVGCPGGEGEDEHDVVWFWLEKGKPLECPVCSQYFKLEVVGPGGDPYGHGDHDHN
ncbi:hypothetical protein VNO78_14506 [Psophocarpus tetragonolobus]|uniref:Cytochrome c oxidase subunit Vb n=1 Tax=Psophocarpus tetragonolobus TaxID=3891 RepID=A0AAN9XQR2_PSOTE